MVVRPGTSHLLSPGPSQRLAATVRSLASLVARPCRLCTGFCACKAKGRRTANRCKRSLSLMHSRPGRHGLATHGYRIAAAGTRRAKHVVSVLRAASHGVPLLCRRCCCSADAVSLPRALSVKTLQRTADAETLWEAVVDFVEPLESLREALKMWGRTATDGAHEIVSDVVLTLDPALACDTFQRTSSPSSVVQGCADLPGPLDFGFPFARTAFPVVSGLDPPPCPAFCYPFIGAAPLAAAKRRAKYLEGVCDVVGLAVQQSKSTRFC